MGSSAANYYGTFDMGGNVWEWIEAISGSRRGVRGGSFGKNDDLLRVESGSFTSPTGELGSFGFRVSQIPAPSAAALLALGGLVTARRRR